MKAYTFVGTVFSVIGILVLIFGLTMVGLINQLASVIDGSSYLKNAIMDAFAPYLVGCIAFFVMGGFCFWAGNRKEPDFTIAVKGQGSPFISDNSSKAKVGYEKISSVISTSDRSIILCGSCGTRNGSDAVFCKKCGGTFIQMPSAITV